MIIKQIPQDFIVEELYDLKELKKKEKDHKDSYHYFTLEKTNYPQLKAIEIVARIFNTSSKRVHFSGTKDKVGITTQLISISGAKKENLEKNLNFFNEKFNDLKLKYIGEFPARLNLGDNIGNKFKITIRDLNIDEIETAKKNAIEISNKGVKNYYDDQRFGYANNSHIVGKYILKNNIKSAIFEILTSLPQNSSPEAVEFTTKIKENFQEICNADKKTIDEIIFIAPKYLIGETQILNHLSKYKNDFPGALRKLHKKLRTLYICAFQSFVFNETIKNIPIEELTDVSLPLINENSTFNDKKIENITNDILKNEEITYEHFKLQPMPELKLLNAQRKAVLKPQKLILHNEEKDELNLNKYKLIAEFELESGAYATNIIKQLLQN